MTKGRSTRSTALLAVMSLLTACVPVVHGAPLMPPPMAPQAGASWNLLFDAEFDDNAAALTPCFDWNAGDCTSTFNLGREHYQPSQVRVAGGVASLVAEPLVPARSDGACYQQVCTYKSGLLATSRPLPSQPYMFTFTYGYVEARMKLPTVPGMFAAFWMLPANPNYVYDYEVDILEYLAGKSDVIYQTYYWNGRQSIYRVNDIDNDTNGNCPKINYASGYHTYGVDWRPEYMAFYIDGTECGRFTATAAGQISDQPMQIIVDLMVDTLWNRSVNLVTPAGGTTDHLDLDYLRVWQNR